jgi:hypothetical protein
VREFGRRDTRGDLHHDRGESSSRHAVHVERYRGRSERHGVGNAPVNGQITAAAVLKRVGGVQFSFQFTADAVLVRSRTDYTGTQTQGYRALAVSHAGPKFGKRALTEDDGYTWT